MPRRSLRTVAGMVIVAGWLAAPAGAQDWLLDLPASTALKPAAVQIPATGGSIPLPLVRTGAGAVASITIRALPFVSDSGERVVASLSANGKPVPEGEPLVVPVGSEPYVEARLTFPALPGPGPYNGTLLVIGGTAVSARHYLLVTAGSSSRPANLQLSPAMNSRVFTIERPWSNGSATAPDTLDPDIGPTFDVRLADAARRWPIGSVDIAPATVTRAPEGFAFQDHVAFYEGNKRITLPRSVPVDGATLQMQLRGLSAGEYNISVPFLAANASSEPRTFALTVTARHGVFYAVLCVSVALLLSFAASKLVEIRGERVRLLDRIQELRPSWLAKESETLAVVWILSILNQASRLSRKRLLPSLDVIHKRLDTVQALLVAMDRLRHARDEITRSDLPQLARARALKLADRLADRLDPEADQAMLTEQLNEIAQLRGWARAGEAAARYQADLTASIQQLLANVDLNAIPTGGRTVVEALSREVSGPQPDNIAALEKRERAYATLKILWERRSAEEFTDLVKMFADSQPVERILDKADDAAWGRLHEQETSSAIAHSGGQSVEAYDPITFSFATGSKDLDATYLVTHGLTYKWTFVVQGSGKGRPFTLEALTRGPRVPQFAPFRGTMTPSVSLVYDRADPARGVVPPLKPGPLVKEGKPITVVSSRRFNFRNGFSLGEIVQLVLAFIVAIITGLQTFYYKAAGFGTLPDYMALFAWGATIDQLKNFLQRLPSAPQTPSLAALTPLNSLDAAVPTPAPAGVNPPVPAVPPNPLANGGAAAVPPEEPIGAPKPPDIPDPPRPNALNLG